MFEPEELLERALVAENELAAAKTQISDLQMRIRELTDATKPMPQIDGATITLKAGSYTPLEIQLSIDLAAEREVLERERLVSDKLVTALAHIVDGSLSLPRFAESQARTAIAEVASLRKGQA